VPRDECVGVTASEAPSLSDKRIDIIMAVLSKYAVSPKIGMFKVEDSYALVCLAGEAGLRVGETTPKGRTRTWQPRGSRRSSGNGKGSQNGLPSSCERGDSNPHDVNHWHLRPARLPIPPRSRFGAYL
jgi:hypothetical protein